MSESNQNNNEFRRKEPFMGGRIWFLVALVLVSMVVGALFAKKHLAISGER